MRAIKQTDPELKRWSKSLSAMGIGKNGFGVEKAYHEHYKAQGVKQNRTRRNPA